MKRINVIKQQTKLGLARSFTSRSAASGSRITAGSRPHARPAVADSRFAALRWKQRAAVWMLANVGGAVPDPSAPGRVVGRLQVLPGKATRLRGFGDLWELAIAKRSALSKRTRTLGHYHTEPYSVSTSQLA